MTRPWRIEWQGVTDVGRFRELNEDSFSAMPDRGVWVVADGMGGHAGGDWASAAVAEAVTASARGEDLDTSVSHCAQAIHAANRSVWDEAQRRGGTMGSTAVTLVLADGRFGVLWAGDSRAYLLRGGVLTRLTRDHSQVQAMVDRGLLAPEEAEGHPMAHVLQRAVGVQPTLDLDVVVDAVEPDDLFLLTTDGVHGVLDDDGIATLANACSVRHLPDALIGRALDGGSRDNLTAVAISVSETTQLMLGTGTEERR